MENLFTEVFEQCYLDSENLFNKEQFIENLKQTMEL